MSDRLRKLIHRFRMRRESRNEFESQYLRDFYRDTYGIEVGLYSYGCFDVRRIPRNTRIGRYCSFSPSCYFLNGNHGLEFLSLHPYLYNTALGVVPEESIRRTRFVIEDDVWVGHNAVILPSVTHIGRGAVIGAGAVVTKNVAAYEIVAGNPARPIRMRFSPEVIVRIEESRWWEKSKAELVELIGSSPQMVFAPATHFGAFAERLVAHASY